MTVIPDRWAVTLTAPGVETIESAGSPASLGAACFLVLGRIEAHGINREWHAEAWRYVGAARTGFGLRLSEVVALGIAERDARKREAEEEARKPLPRLERTDGGRVLVLVTRDGDGRVVRRTVNPAAPWTVRRWDRVEVVTLENGGERWTVPALVAADALDASLQDSHETSLVEDDGGVTIEAPTEFEPVYRLLARAEWRD